MFALSLYFRKRTIFSVTAHDLMFYFTAVWILQKQSFEGVVKKGVLKNLENFTGKHLYWGLILVKLVVTAPVQYSFLVCNL